MERRLRHLDGIDHNADGGLVLISSNLTSRIWNGEVLYFENCVGDVALSECQTVAAVESGITDVKWIPTTRRILLAGDSGSVELWELSEEKDCLTCVARPIEHDSIVSSISVNSSATKFVSTSYDRSIRIWNVEEYQPIHILKGHTDIVWSAAFHSSNPDIFSSCSQDGRVLVWDLRQPRSASVMESQFLPSLPTCVTWQPGAENAVAVGTETGHILLQDCRVGVGIPTRAAVHSRLVHRMQFAPHRHNWLASVSNDCTSAVTSFAEDKTNLIFRNVREDFVQGVSWNPVNHQLYTCSWDGMLISRSPENLDDSFNMMNGSTADDTSEKMSSD